MSRILVFTFLFTTPAFAHWLPLKDEVLLKLANESYKEAFQLEAACDRLELNRKKCRSFLKVGHPISPIVTHCVLKQFYLNEVFDKPSRKWKERPHHEVLWDKEFGNHFHVGSPALADDAERPYTGQLMKNRAAMKSAKFHPASTLLDKAEIEAATEDAKYAR